MSTSNFSEIRRVKCNSSIDRFLNAIKFFNYNNCQIRFLQSCILLEETEILYENLEEWKMTGKEISIQN